MNNSALNVALMIFIVILLIHYCSCKASSTDHERDTYNFHSVLPQKTEDKEDDETDMRNVLRATLRDGVEATEDNLGEVSEEVKRAFSVPSAAQIRDASSMAWSMMPEITSNKTEGYIDGSTQLYRNREPLAASGLHGGDRPSDWMLTDAYEYQKERS